MWMHIYQSWRMPFLFRKWSCLFFSLTKWFMLLIEQNLLSYVLFGMKNHFPVVCGSLYTNGSKHGDRMLKFFKYLNCTFIIWHKKYMFNVAVDLKILIFWKKYSDNNLNTRSSLLSSKNIVWSFFFNHRL